MGRTLGLDVETSKLPVAFPWQKGAFLVSVGLADETGWRKTWTFNHKEYTSPQSQREMIDEIQAEILTADRLVGHNLKFDLNWLNHLGILYDNCQLFCTQIVEYLLEGQRIGHLSLNDLSKKYLSVDKIDRVKMFWDAGYETDEIPMNVLIPYLEQDCINALAVYQRQAKRVTEENMNALVAVQCEQTRVLSAIESNGMKFDVGVATTKANELEAELEDIEGELRVLFDRVVNFSSPDELSAVLYGGVIKTEGEEWVVREYKYYSRYYPRKCIVTEEVKGIGFKPTKKMETKKKGVFKTNKNTLQFLGAKTKKQKRVVELLLKRSERAKALETLRGKDGSGLINKVQRDGCVHPKYNQTVAKTGRLSSSDPEHVGVFKPCELQEHPNVKSWATCS